MSAATIFRRAAGTFVLAGAMAALVACSSAPPAPEWQMNSKGALERAVAAWLEGNTRVEAAESLRARSEAARIGQVDVVARVELTRCAARVAALVFEPCQAFEALRADAAPPERAYADYLRGTVAAQDLTLLPPHHRAAASGGDAGLPPATDPLARLVAAGVLFQMGRATPATVQLAVDTASAQGWRRPLLAWLGVQAQLAEKAGDAQAAARIRRRIDLVQP